MLAHSSEDVNGLGSSVATHDWNDSLTSSASVMLLEPRQETQEGPSVNTAGHRHESDAHWPARAVIGPQDC